MLVRANTVRTLEVGIRRTFLDLEFNILQLEKKKRDKGIIQLLHLENNFKAIVQKLN